MPRAKKAKKPVESHQLPTIQELARASADLEHAYETHARPLGLYAWQFARLMAARDAQVRGVFREPVALQRSLQTEPKIYSASLNRLAPHRGFPRTIEGESALEGTSAQILTEAIATFATDRSSSLPTTVIADDFERVVDFGVSVDQTHWNVRPDGSRHDAFVTPWPLEATEWSPNDKMLIAHTVEGRRPIVHGDGRWIVSAKHHDQPWRKGAIVALANLWIDLAFGRRDRSKNAESHGEDKWLGTLPEGVAIDSKEGKALLAEMKKLYEFRRVLLKPFGAEVQRSEALGQNWQIFKELLGDSGKDAQLVYLGQDGTMTNSGGSYIKAGGLFGVRNDLVESDVTTIGAGYSTGLLRPWSMINFGRWDRLIYKWLIPDSDEDTRRAEIANRRKAFWEDLAAARANGVLVDQPYVNKVAKAFGVDPPTLAAKAPGGGELYAYELEGGVFTINEFRARKGEASVPWGDVTKPERDAQIRAQSGDTTTPPISNLSINRAPLRPAVAPASAAG